MTVLRFEGSGPRPLVAVLLALALLAVGLLALAASPVRAAERPFNLEFDQSTIDVSLLGEVPIDELSGPSSIEGTIDENGNIKIPKGNFKLPVIDVSNVAQSLIGIELPVEIKGFMGIEEAATGTFDSATGQMEIQTKAGLWITVNPQQLLGLVGGLGGDLGGLGSLTGLLGTELTCGFSPMDVNFTTETTSVGTGQRFTEGLQGPGALTGEWSQLGPFAGKTKILIFDVCSLLRSQLPSLLSGLGGGTGIDLGGIDIAGLLSGLDDLDLGPSGLTIARTLDESPTPASLKLKVGPKRVKIRTGKAARLKTVVTNQGGVAARNVRVCASVKEVKVRGAGCRKLGTVAAGKSKTGRFTLRLKPGKRNRSVKVNFVVRSGATRAAGASAWITKTGR